MGLRTKLNLLLLVVALLGAGLLAIVSTPFLNTLAKDDVVERSRIMMESAAGARRYTSEQVAPLLQGVSTRISIRRPFPPMPRPTASRCCTRSFPIIPIAK